MGVKFTNNAFTTLSSSINAGATSFSVASVSTFPSLGSGDYMYVSLTDEVVKVTAISGTTLTCVAVSGGHSAGIAVELRMTAELLNDFAEDDESLQLAGGAMTGNITMAGSQTVDGRDLSVDGAKLDGIETSATADQTAAQIKTALENGIDSVHYVDGSIDAEHIAADAVTEAKLNLISTGSVPSLEAKGDGSSQDGYIQLNCSQNSHGIKLKSPPHSANASYTLTFPNNDGSANEYLQTNGSGVLAWNAVDLTALSATNLTSGTVPAARITAASIANDLIDSQHYAAASVDNEHLADNAVGSDEIADNVALGGSPTTTTQAESDNTTKLATTAYVTAKITTLIGGAPSTLNDLNELALAINDDANYNSTLTTALATKAPLASPTFTGNIGMPAGSIDHAFLAADCVDGDNIADNAINSEHIAADSIDAEHLAPNSVNSDAYIDDSILSAHYEAGSVDATALGADCVTAAKIGDDVINSEHIAAGAIDNEHIADDQINSEHYADGSIDTAHIADNQVTGAKLASDRRDGGSAQDVYTGNQHDFIHFDGDVGIKFHTANAEDMRLLDDGTLHVDGDVVAFSSTISDETLKYDINPIDHALDKVAQLTGVTYKYLKDGMESAGLLAQDVEKVMPCAVRERKLPLHTGTNKKYKTLNYDNLHALLIESIKELTAKVEKLENK